MNKVEQFLKSKFNCNEDEIQKQLYDLISDPREWSLVIELFEDYKNYGYNQPTNLKEAIETAWDKTRKIHGNTQ